MTLEKQRLQLSVTAVKLLQITDTSSRDNKNNETCHRHKLLCQEVGQVLYEANSSFRTETAATDCHTESQLDLASLACAWAIRLATLSIITAL